MTHAAGGGIEALAPSFKFYQGPYGRICPDSLGTWQPPFQEEDDIKKHFKDMADVLMIERPLATPSDIVNNPALVEKLKQYDSKIPAGYTYFGQFIDHDITFDPISSLMRKNDPNGLLNHRTPRLDLDNIYGSGPKASPHLYNKDDKALFLIDKIKNTNLCDLPRNCQGIAILGDPRNDENAMVSQLQLAFLSAHNNLVERAREETNNISEDDAFEQARTTLRWLYQWIVWNDFIPRIANNEIYKSALVLRNVFGSRKTWELGLKHVYEWKYHPFMPVEFSVAAYRFGHSMVRNSYLTNENRDKPVPIFDNQSNIDLRGFRYMTKENTIQWNLFLELKESSDDSVQRARKIDTLLSNALSFLSEDPDDPNSLDNILAYRNLLKGFRFDLPSGTAVAEYFNIKPIHIDQDKDALWFYILKEAEGLPGRNGGQMLGRLGSTIVCATIAGLLKGDPSSYLNVDPEWTPDKDMLLKDEYKEAADGPWTLASIIRLSGLPVTLDDINKLQ